MKKFILSCVCVVVAVAAALVFGLVQDDRPAGALGGGLCITGDEFTVTNGPTNYHSINIGGTGHFVVSADIVYEGSPSAYEHVSTSVNPGGYGLYVNFDINDHFAGTKQARAWAIYTC